MSIRACPKITPDGLLSCVALPFLQRFEYWKKYWYAIPDDFMIKIASQNPSLEVISGPYAAWSMNDKQLIKEANSRVTKIIEAVRLFVLCY